MNDVLRTLREARPAELDPDAPIGEGVRRTELARAMAAGAGTATPRKTARRRVRPVWGLSLAGAVAAGALVAVTLVPADGNEPGRDDEPGAEKPLDAKTVLLAAAKKAEGQTDEMRTYWHRATIVSQTYMTGRPGARYAIVTRDKTESWTSGEPGVKGWGRERYLGAKPATKEDAETWRRAGSPDTFQVRVAVAPGYKVTKPRTAKAAPGPVTTRKSNLDGGDEVFWIGRNVTVKDLRSLPSDPKRLKAQLMRWYEGHGTESGRPMDAGEWLYRVTRGLVMFMPVRPEVRAAGFRMLAGLPSVKSIGVVEDSRGRTGNAIAVDERTPGGVVRHQMIIDLSSGTALASENIMLRPAAGTEIPAGWTLVSTAVVSTEWTDSPPR